MTAARRRRLAAVLATAGLAVMPGCGDAARTGRSPVLLVIMSLEAASGATPTAFGGTLDSDVLTNVSRTVEGGRQDVPTVFSDVGRVSLRFTLKDPGVPGGAATPSALNQVTINRYQVVYRRSDGRNTPGVDVPHPFDSAVTVTLPTEGAATAAFELVRHTAKGEAPLAALRTNGVIISAMADITFSGHDLAGNAVTVTGSIGVQFGNFGDSR
ncbi:MAG: hypothetical protein ABL971_02400 [Vicinamibacterales bacterium]